MVTNVSMSEQEILDIIMDTVLGSKWDLSDHEVFERILDEVTMMITDTEFVNDQELVGEIEFLVYNYDEYGNYLPPSPHADTPEEIEPIPEGW